MEHKTLIELNDGITKFNVRGIRVDNIQMTQAQLDETLQESGCETIEQLNTIYAGLYDGAILPKIEIIEG